MGSPRALPGEQGSTLATRSRHPALTTWTTARSMKTGINFERCNIGSAEMHNTRDPKYIAAVNASPNKHYSIFEDQMKMNVSWVNPAYQGKTLPGLLDELRAIYREKVGQAPQEQDRVREVTDKKTGLKKTVTTAGWSPIREGVCPILPNTQISDFGPFIEWLQSKGLQAVRLDLHHDEGHTDELTGERKYNHHAHIVVDWIDHNTGKSRKLSKEDTREMQTQLAASLRMERGVSKEITGADHLSPDEQRAKAAAERVKALEEKETNLEAQIIQTSKAVKGIQVAADDAVRDCCHQLQHLGTHLVQHFDMLTDTKAVKPTKFEQEKRDALDKESRRDLSKTTGAALNHQETLLRNLIVHTSQAIERFNNRLRQLAKSVPLLQLRKGRLAHEAELQAQVAAADKRAADSMSAANKAVEQAKIDQKTAISEAQRIADSKVAKANKSADEKVAAAQEEARLAKEAASKAETEAKKREQAAKAEEKKYQGFNRGFEQQLDEAKTAASQTGYSSGYSTGFDEGKQEQAQKVAELRQEISTMKSNQSTVVGKYRSRVMELQLDNAFFRSTNPLLRNYERNRDELEKTGWGITKEEMATLFSGGTVEREYREKRNYKEIVLPIRIDIGESKTGDMRVWYNDKTWNDCLEELKEQVIAKGKSNGISW